MSNIGSLQNFFHVFKPTMCMRYEKSYAKLSGPITEINRRPIATLLCKPYCEENGAYLL